MSPAIRRSIRASWAADLSRDGWLLFASCAVRAFAYGFLSVVLGLYLAALGLGSDTIGVLFTVAMAGAAGMTLVMTTVADRIGRRLVLSIGALLMALAGAVFAVTDNPAVLAAAAVVGTINPSTREAGPFPSIEQAALPETTTDEQRTSVFAAYHLVRSLASAVGALAAGAPAFVGLAPLAGYQALIWSYAVAALVLLIIFTRLSPRVEAPTRSRSPTRPLAQWHASRPRHPPLARHRRQAGRSVQPRRVRRWLHR